MIKKLKNICADKKNMKLFFEWEDGSWDEFPLDQLLLTLTNKQLHQKLREDNKNRENFTTSIVE